MARETVHLTSEMVRVLAHPLRARLLGLLRLEGASTATRLARRTGTNSGATSYHLRQLAAVGLVAEDHRAEPGRQRWWRAAHQESSWRESEHDADPEARAAADWLVRSFHRNYAKWVDEWLDARTGWPVAWRDAADQSDFQITVDAGTLAELNQRVHDLIREYEDLPPVEGAEPVAILYYTFPRSATNI